MSRSHRHIQVKVDGVTPKRWVDTVHNMWLHGDLSTEERDACYDFIKRCVPILFVKRI